MTLTKKYPEFIHKGFIYKKKGAIYEDVIEDILDKHFVRKEIDFGDLHVNCLDKQVVKALLLEYQMPNEFMAGYICFSKKRWDELMKRLTP